MHALLIDDIRSFDPSEAGADTIATVRNSRDGVAALEAGGVDLLLLDYHLEWQNADRHDTGLAVVAWLQANADRFRCLRVLIVTDHDEVAPKMKAGLDEAGIACEISDLGHRWNEAHR